MHPCRRRLHVDFFRALILFITNFFLDIWTHPIRNGCRCCKVQLRVRVVQPVMFWTFLISCLISWNTWLSRLCFLIYCKLHVFWTGDRRGERVSSADDFSLSTNFPCRIFTFAFCLFNSSTMDCQSRSRSLLLLTLSDITALARLGLRCILCSTPRGWNLKKN